MADLSHHGEERTSSSAAKGASLTIRRRLPAPPEEVFDAWLDADGMRHWMTPGRAGEARVRLDARVGGSFQIDMIEGTRVYEHRGEYLVIDRPRRLVFTWISEGSNQQRSVVTVELQPAGDRGQETELTLTHDGLPTADAARQHEEGWTEILELLGARIGD